MTIRPITPVSFGANYNRLTFEGRKDNENYRPSYLKNTLRSIPLATLIAMSPLNSNVSLYAQKPVEEVIVMSGRVQNATIPDALGEMPKCEINFISTDGDDNTIEKLNLSFVDWDTGTQKINGKRTKCKYAYSKFIDLEALEVRKEIRKYSGSEDKESERYFVSGSGKFARSNFHDLDGNPYDTGGFIRKADHLEQEISKDFYDYLANYLKGSGIVEFKTSTKVIDGDQETRDYYDAITGGGIY